MLKARGFAVAVCFGIAITMWYTSNNKNSPEITFSVRYYCHFAT